MAPSVARIPTECGVRIRKADARMCVRARPGSPSFFGTVTTPLSLHLSLSPLPAMRTYVYVRGLCELSMVEQRFVLCRRGIAMVALKGPKN